MTNFDRKNLRWNYIVNLLDGSFFGMAFGFVSISTIIPLFVSSMTDSKLLIGLIPAIHSVGWQLPQLFMARNVSKLKKYKPFVFSMTVQERIPFFFLGLMTWFLPGASKELRLVITFLLLTWQGLGGGFGANAWQNMIGKLIPSDFRGAFFGFQSAAANLFASGAAIAAGIILEKFESPLDFTILFFSAIVCFAISWFFLGQTREPDENPVIEDVIVIPFWKTILDILRKDRSFRWFLICRSMLQFGFMASAFYTVYAVRVHGVSESTAGILASVLMITQTIANPLLGWLGDRWSRKWILVLGAIACFLSCLLAWLAPSVGLFFVVIILIGFANTAYWTVGLAFTLDFGEEKDRATYVGLANTLIAPATIIAPILGGWLVDLFNYSVTFIAAAVMSLLTALAYLVFVRDPEKTIHHPSVLN
jgi:MFS family permease